MSSQFYFTPQVNGTAVVLDDDPRLTGGGGGGAGAVLVATAKTANYTAAVNDFVVVDATSGAVTITAPAAPSANDIFAVKKADNSENLVTIARSGSQLINGDTEVGLTAPGAAVTLLFDGTNWQMLSTGTANSTTPAPGASVDVQRFTTPGAATWTKPAGAKMCSVLVVNGGTGGGSGRRGAPGTIRVGGGGGSTGGISRQDIPADALPATVNLTVGYGSPGGAAVTTDNTDGNAAGSANPCVSNFGTYVKTGTGQSVPSNQGGATGAGGLAATSGSAMASGLSGAAASTAGSVGGTASSTVQGGPGAGGAGGGIIAANVANNGGAGSNIQITLSYVQSGGVVDSTPPPAGYSQPVGSGLPGHGGGGGAASVTQAAQAGANGGLYGGAGGGGGASTNGFNSGKGGDGAPGIIIVTTYF